MSTPSQERGVAGKGAAWEGSRIASTIERAEAAVRLASADAVAARRLAGQALAAADDAETRSTAERALGLAAIELGRADSAVLHLRAAVDSADSGGLTRRSGE